VRAGRGCGTVIGVARDVNDGSQESPQRGLRTIEAAMSGSLTCAAGPAATMFRNSSWRSEEIKIPAAGVAI